MKSTTNEEAKKQIKKEFEDDLIQEKLYTMIKAAGSIKSMNCCLQELDRLACKEADEGEFTFLNLACSAGLEQGIELLANLIETNGNDLCETLGFTRWS